MANRSLDLDLLPGLFAVAKLPPEATVPSWALRHALSSVTRTSEELSVVCPDEGVPSGVAVERGFRCFRVRGPLAFSETGVLASLAQPLAEVGISIFVLSTFQTDYLLVREPEVERASHALLSAGHTVQAQGRNQRAGSG